MPENKNMSQLEKTPNQPGIHGWINGHSIFYKTSYQMNQKFQYPTK